VETLCDRLSASPQTMSPGSPIALWLTSCLAVRALLSAAWGALAFIVGGCAARGVGAFATMAVGLALTVIVPSAVGVTLLSAAVLALRGS
jgi:hypothetical protein